MDIEKIKEATQEIQRILGTECKFVIAFYEDVQQNGIPPQPHSSKFKFGTNMQACNAILLLQKTIAALNHHINQDNTRKIQQK